MTDEPLYVLLLHGLLFTPLMARNALKSNVTWSSYPILPPTGASGCLAELLGHSRWHEGNSLELDARRLNDMPGYESVFALGAYPSRWRFSRRHFRAHVQDIFNYEAAIWSPGQNKGKKLAVVEEVLSDTITFVVGASDPVTLENVHRMAHGRLAPIGKKGSVQVAYSTPAEVLKFTPTEATGEEFTLTLLPVTELGSLPRSPSLPGQTLACYVPMRSQLQQGTMQWDLMPSIWGEDMKIRAGVPIFAGDYGGRSVGVSQHVWARVKGA